MASWNEILDKFGHMPSQYDLVRRDYLRKLSDYTGRNTILYYSAWLQKSLLANGSFDFGINDNDKTGFMTCIYKLDKSKGLDLILHTPGGDISATESLVVYLKSIFGKDIDWSNGLVKQWLLENMFEGLSDAENKAVNVIENIGSHALTKSHSRHLHIDNLRDLGLSINALEDDEKLQDLVLSIHHSTIITFGNTKAAKIIENQNGVSFINTIG